MELALIENNKKHVQFDPKVVKEDEERKRRKEKEKVRIANLCVVDFCGFLLLRLQHELCERVFFRLLFHSY